MHFQLVAYTAPVSETQHEHLPVPVVVATITGDKRILGALTAHHQLEILAAKFGIVDFEIRSSQDLIVAGYQQQLPFPTPAKNRPRRLR